MTLMLLGQYFLIMRSSMVDVLTEDFVTVKRATGLPWHRVVRRHAVPNALLPLVTLSAIQFGAVAGGAITIETIFSWPGLGLLSYDAINDKDFPVLQGTFLVFSVGGDPRQPARRLPLLLPRPAGAVAMSPEQTASRRWSPRRGAELVDGRRASATSCSGPGGGASGSGVVALFAFVAIFGSALAPYDPNASSLDVLARAELEPRRWARPRAAPTSSPSSSSAPASRWSSASPRRSSRPCSARRSASPAATSAAGPTASSTRSRTGSW